MIVQRTPTGPRGAGTSDPAGSQADQQLEVDPLLLPADDPDATARMAPEDFDWYTATGPDHADAPEPLREHSHIEHSHIEHSSGEHSSGGHSSGEHSRGEHSSGEHRQTEHRQTEHRQTEHRQTEHSALALVLQADQIEVAVVAEHGGVIARQASVPVAGLWDDPDVAMSELRDRVGEMLHAIDLSDPLRLTGIGVAVDGQVNARTGDVSFTTSAGQSEVPIPLRDLLNEEFTADPAHQIRLLSVGAAVGAAEHWRGAAVGRRDALVLQLSDAIEGALVLDGELQTGPTGNAGRIGHVSVDPYGPECSCGGRGCLQAIAGGAAIVEWAVGHGAGRKPADQLSLDTGPAVATSSGGSAVLPHADVLGVAAAARRGDPVALATFRRAGEAIGQAVAGAVTLLDLDVVVIAGPLAAAGPVLFDPIADGYQRYAALPYACGPRIVPALLGTDAVAIGAAAAVLARGHHRPHRP